MLRWLPLVFFVACAALLGSLMLAGKPEHVSTMVQRHFPFPSHPELMTGSAAPEHPAPFTLYNVFASWCVPCAAEIPQLEALAKQPGIEMVGIAWSDKKEEIETFTQKYGNPFARIYDDAKGAWGIALGIRGVPESFVVNADGAIVLHIPGEITDADMNDIAALLAGKKL